MMMLSITFIIIIIEKWFVQRWLAVRKEEADDDDEEMDQRRRTRITSNRVGTWSFAEVEGMIWISILLTRKSLPSTSLQ